MGKHDHCCVPNCNSRRDDGYKRAFHHFPEDPDLRKKWIVAIKRDVGQAFAITESTVVCSEHFTDSQYSGAIPPRTEEQRCAVAGVRHVYRTCKDAVPFYSKAEIAKSLVKRPAPKERGPVPPSKKKAEKPLTPEELELIALREKVENLEQKNHQQQKEIEKLREELVTARMRCINYVTLRSKALAEETSGMAAGKKMPVFEFYTGLSTSAFDALWAFLQPSEENIVSQRSAATGDSRRRSGGPASLLSLEDQLLITLMRLRLGLLVRDLADRFEVSESTVSRIFQKWINFLYLRLGSLPLWPTWEHVHSTMPASFRESYPSTFIIIDATELHVEIPASLSLQSQNYSQYKSNTTNKGLLGIAPNGTITFVSQLFTGSISDRELTLQSGILDLLKSVPPGKSVMADRGFEIQDLLVPYNLLLNIPPFRGASGVLSEADVKKTQQIARVRIHVERVIGQVKKTFRILRGVIPMSQEGCINQVWTVCCLLTNFKGPIIEGVGDTDDE